MLNQTATYSLTIKEIYLDSLNTSNTAAGILSDCLSTHFAQFRNFNSNGKEEEEPVQQQTQLCDVANLFDKINNDIINVLQPALKATVINRCVKPLNAMLAGEADVVEKLNKRKLIMVDKEIYFEKVKNDNDKIQKDTLKINTKVHEDLVRHNNKYNHLNNLCSVWDSLF